MFRAIAMSFTWDCADFMIFPPNYPEDRQSKFIDKKDNQNALIIANSNISPIIVLAWERTKLHICADGGANRLYHAVEDKNKWIPEYIKGDLDSISSDVLQFYKDKGTTVIHEHDQDSTDLEKCLRLLESHEVKHSIKFRTTLVAGGLGGSFTHEMANCNALFKHKNRHIILWSETNATWLLDTGKHDIDVPNNTKCGVLPVGGKCSNATTTGLKWNLENGELEFGALVSTSNVTVSEHVTIQVSSPVLWTIDFVQ